jgi:hypothetical protein
MSQSLAAKLDRVERKPLKCSLGRTSDVFVRGGEIFEQARECSGLTREQAASEYGVSASLLARQATNQDNQHLSFQRICEMPERFQHEVIRAWAERLGGVEVATTVTIRRTS